MLINNLLDVMKMSWPVNRSRNWHVRKHKERNEQLKRKDLEDRIKLLIDAICPNGYNVRFRGKRLISLSIRLLGRWMGMLGMSLRCKRT